MHTLYRIFSGNANNAVLATNSMPAPQSGTVSSGSGSALTNNVTKPNAVTTTTKPLQTTFSAPTSSLPQTSSNNCNKSSIASINGQLTSNTPSTTAIVAKSEVRCKSQHLISVYTFKGNYINILWKSTLLHILDLNNYFFSLFPSTWYFRHN